MVTREVRLICCGCPLFNKRIVAKLTPFFNPSKWDTQMGINWKKETRVFGRSCYEMSTKCFLWLGHFFNEPGTLVPNATKAIALTESFRKMKHPRWPATSPIKAVQAPIAEMEITKQGYPFAIAVLDICKSWWKLSWDNTVLKSLLWKFRDELNELECHFLGFSRTCKQMS